MHGSLRPGRVVEIVSDKPASPVYAVNDAGTSDAGAGPVPNSNARPASKLILLNVPGICVEIDEHATKIANNCILKQVEKTNFLSRRIAT